MSRAVALPPALPVTSRAPVVEPEGICRACGCTDDYACDGGCTWVEETLCSACHGPKQPTRRQAGEIARIEDRQGPVVVRPASLPGCLEAILYGSPDDRQFRLENGHPARSLTLDPRGRVIRTDLVLA